MGRPPSQSTTSSTKTRPRSPTNSAEDAALQIVRAVQKRIRSESTVDIEPPSARAQNTTPNLPCEIVEMIVKLADSESQRVCTQVNLSWANLARREIWKSCLLGYYHNHNRFLELIQAQPSTLRGGILTFSKIKSFITMFRLEVSTPTIDVQCRILSHLGCLKKLSVSSLDHVREGYLSRLADVCPKTVTVFSFSTDYLGTRVGTRPPPEEYAVDGPTFRKLQRFFRQFTDIIWESEVYPDAILAGIHDRLRVLQINWGLGFPQEKFTRIVCRLPPTLVAFDAPGYRKLGGKELVILANRCPNLKGIFCTGRGTATNEEWEEFFSKVGPSLEFLATTIDSPQDLHIITRYCRSIKHVHLLSQSHRFDGNGNEVVLSPPAQQDYDSFLRHVGSTIVNITLVISRSCKSFGAGLLPRIMDSCPRIQRLRFMETADKALEEKDVQLLFERCKALRYIRHDVCGENHGCTDWKKCPNSTGCAFFDFHDYIQTI